MKNKKYEFLAALAIMLLATHSVAGDKMSNAKPVPEPTQIIKDLRQKVLSLSPGDIGLTQPKDGSTVWGILMETGYPGGLATLIVLADGTTSLYFGHGGGIIGAGEHDSVRTASMRFLAVAEQYQKALEPTKSFPYPHVGTVRFYVLTFSGPLTAAADENDLGNRTHALSNLFYAGHEVLTELRHIDEKKEK
ncbi:MAG: hypothetical protein GTN81_13880 [Proteobacteria bacterium]|nr:hypothetical protein [Pseudomonadota bacterium]